MDGGIAAEAPPMARQYGAQIDSHITEMATNNLVHWLYCTDLHPESNPRIRLSIHYNGPLY